MEIQRPTCLDSQTFKMENIKIVGQFNKQIILVLVPSGGESILHGFDQHGVHERIRFEEILSSAVEYSPQKNIRCRELYPPFEFNCNIDSLIGDIITYRTQLFSLCSLNLDVRKIQITGQPEENFIIVRHIPASFTSYFHVTLMKRCIIDAVRYVKKQNKNNQKQEQSGIFPYLLNHIRSRACHGAIRFGETLSKQSSKHMIHQLSKCKQQFRCAHGRVLAKPLCRIPINEERMDLIKKEEIFEQEFGKIQIVIVQKY